MHSYSIELTQDQHRGGRFRDVAILDLRTHQKTRLFPRPLDKHTHTSLYVRQCIVGAGKPDNS